MTALLTAVSLGAVACSTTDPVTVDAEALAGVALSAGSDAGTSDASLDYDSSFAWDVDANIRFEHWSLALGVQQSSATVALGNTGVALAPGDIDTRTLAFVLQWHPMGLAKLDPYIGVGAAFLFASDTDLRFAEDASRTARLHFEQAAALVAEAGVRFALSSRFGILLDGKYCRGEIPAAISIQDIPGGALPNVPVRVVMLTGGVSYRF